MTQTHGSKWWVLLCGIALSSGGCFPIEAPAEGGFTSNEGADSGADDDDDDNGVIDAGPRPDSRRPDGDDTLLSQSTSQNIEIGNSIACSDGDGEHFENSYYRVFDLTALGVSGALGVTEVDFGVEFANAANGTSQPVNVKLHTLAGAQLTTGDLTLLTQVTHQVLDTVGTLETVPITATVAASSKLVVEIHTPDGRASAYQFYIGSNNDGESGPGYLRAQVCDSNEPATLASIGFGSMHMVINVRGTAQ